MSSVTQRIKEIHQPRGGYLNPKEFKTVYLDDGIQLHENENKHAGLVGLVVDYMSRYMSTGDINEAFKISRLGAKIKGEMFGNEDEEMEHFEDLLNGIKGTDDVSLAYAFEAVGYDVFFRATPTIEKSQEYETKEKVYPDKDTLENVRTMINRSLSFFKEYGPVTSDGFTFEPYGYTDVVDTGDGDFITKNIMWDFKVSKNPPTNAHTLQLLMYYIMGKHSGQEKYNEIDTIGVYNPRLNSVYLYELKNLPEETIKKIESEVICYSDDPEKKKTVSYSDLYER